MYGLGYFKPEPAAPVRELTEVHIIDPAAVRIVVDMDPLTAVDRFNIYFEICGYCLIDDRRIVVEIGW